MKYELIVRDRCQKDLAEAVTWYERRQEGLGERLVAAVEDVLSKLKKKPDRGVIVYKMLRRTGVRRFPYGVFYQVVGERIVVVGVIHNRRAPRRWKLRLE